MIKNYHFVIILVMAMLIFASACGSTQTPDVQDTENPPVSVPESPTEIPTEAASDSEEAYPAPMSPVEVYNPYPGPSDGVMEWTEWQDAVVVINSGDVLEVYEVETLHVTLVLADGRVILAKEPEFGEVSRLLQACGDACKDVVIKSE